jgi:hypothetical protein
VSSDSDAGLDKHSWLTFSPNASGSIIEAGQTEWGDAKSSG